MTLESLYLLAVLLGALALFYKQWLRPDLTALLVMLSLLVPWRLGPDGFVPLLSPEEAFSGFGSTAVLMVLSLFAVSAGLVRTGVAELLGKRLFERCAHDETLLQGAVLTAVAASSSVLNDTAAVLVWMPVVVGFCHDRGLNPSRYLLAVAYGSLLGGQWTLMGTRSNIIISDLMAKQTGRGLGFFEFTPVALAVFAACLAFYLTVGLKLLPAGRGEESLAEAYQVTEFLTEVLVTPQSDAVGRTLGELNLQEQYGVEVIELVKGTEHVPASPWVRVHRDDVLIVQGPSSRMARLLKSDDYSMRAELEVEAGTLRSVDLVMAEALVARHSSYIGRPPQALGLMSELGLALLAVSGYDKNRGERASEVPLRFGDTLLLCGHPENFERLGRRRDLLLVDSKPLTPLQPRRALLMAAILTVTVATIATGLLPAASALAFAAAGTLISGCVRMRELYAAIDWTAIVVLGGMIPYGLALQKTGAAERLAHAVAEPLAALGAMPTLAVLMAFALACAQLLQKTAVAVILTPIYLQLAAELGLRPEPVMLALALILSSAFMTPFAHESTILVMGPGRYRFRDYVQLGLGFAVLNWLLISLLVPVQSALQ